MRVICVNAQPIEGHGNQRLYLLKEGRIYEVLDYSKEYNSYNIGVGTYQGNPIYWGADRFLECQEDPREEERKINIKGRVDGNKRPNSEGNQGPNNRK
jgi:hypothetical protein